MIVRYHGNLNSCPDAAVSATGCPPGSQPVFSVAYLGFYDPANICQNYLGDIYRIPTPVTPWHYSFTVPAFDHEGTWRWDVSATDDLGRGSTIERTFASLTTCAQVLRAICLVCNAN